jgi:TATA-binding protein-associated factor Taf7
METSMNRQETQVAKDIVIEKLNQVSPELIQTVSNFLDHLLETQKKALATDAQSDIDEISRGEWITTWDQWFEEVDELPLSDPSQVNLTKAERRELIAEDVAKKYDCKWMALT